MKMKKFTGFLLVLLILMAGIVGTTSLTSCMSDKKEDKTITISGAFALYPLVVKWSEEYKKINPDVTFNISAGGAGKGMTDALSGTADLGMYSKAVSKEEYDKGCWRIGTVIDAVVPTVNANNPYINIIKERGLTCEQFTAIFIDGTVTTWEQALNIKSQGVTPINVYTRSDACGAADTWAAYLGKKKQENLKGTGVNADPGLADAVAKDVYGIGFNNTIYAYDIKTGNKRENLEVIPIDINGNGKIDTEESVYSSFTTILKAIKDGVYPSPPARELNIVSKGKPQKQCVIDFLKWCLTDGQKFVTEAGYVELPQEKLEEYLKSLE